MSNKTYRLISYQLLMPMQYRLKYLKFVVTDKFYIIRPIELYYMDFIFQQITMKPDMLFVGVLDSSVGPWSANPR